MPRVSVRVVEELTRTAFRAVGHDLGAALKIENEGTEDEAVLLGRDGISIMRGEYWANRPALGNPEHRTKIDGWTIYRCAYDPGDRDTPPSVEPYEDSTYPNHADAVRHAVRLYLGEIIDNAINAEEMARAYATVRFNPGPAGPCFPSEEKNA